MKIFKKISIMSIVLMLLFYSVPAFAEYDEFNNVNKTTTLDQKIGMNGFVDCKQENLTAGGILREYHNFGWTYDANSGKCYFQSSWFNFDEFYKNVHDLGITILPCIQQGNNKENREYKPVENGADTLDPSSYKIHSNVLFNYAARYGYEEVDASRLNLTSNTEAKSGLGYITYYENWNEPDKTWIGEKACFSPEEFAAMCSADYDGHEGTLGDTYGIKQADPNAKLVYGGLAGGQAGVNFLERMKAWSEENRPSKTLPFDVINFHMYCGTNSPEASSFAENAMALIEWRNENAPDKEIWITEFGWDTNTSSPRSAPSYDTQRDWILREYLIADRIGLDRATVYNGRDDGAPNNTTQYATCGLTTQKGSEERKSSWYGVNTLKTTLTGFKLSKVLNEESNLYVYKYTNSDTNEDCYVLWSPTQDGSKIDNYELKVSNAESATLTELKDKETVGVNTSLTIENDIVKVNVSESPIFVKVKSNSNEQPSEPTEEEPSDKNDDQNDDSNKQENPEEPENSEEPTDPENTEKKDEPTEPTEPAEPKNTEKTDEPVHTEDKQESVDTNAQEQQIVQNEGKKQDNTSYKKTDTTISDKKIPFTGINTVSIILFLSIVLYTCIISFILYKKHIK